MQNFIGQEIDRYRITECLGMGGMAVVYKAYDTRLERDVAIKLIRTESIPQDQHERLLMRFEQEAKAQARFSHPNIVSVHDYGEFNESPYLVMEHISGGTLKKRIIGPVDYLQAVKWILPIADAIQYAHDRNIIHRDIKPSNILFDENDRPMLTDFGIAKLMGSNSGTLTGTGLGVGTPEYMAPEQWQGQAYEATDQYSLGVVLYELITGQKPYQADTPAAVAIMQATEPLKAPSRLVNDIPEAVEKVLYKALANNPLDRFEDMQVLKTALEGLLVGDHKSVPTPVKTPAPKMTSPQVESVNSESKAVDALGGTPLEGSRTREKSVEKQKFPNWLMGLGAGLLLIGLVIGIIQVLGGIKENRPVPISDSVKDTPFPVATTEVPAHTMSVTPINTRIPTEIPTETQPQVPILAIGSEMVNPIDGVVMKYVPAGEFIMGSNDVGADENERPQHRVNLDSYWIYQNEVTNAQFREFVEHSAVLTSAEIMGWSWVFGNGTNEVEGAFWSAPEGKSTNIDNRLNHPVVHVSYSDALNYCRWAGGRLPTEAEWEKASKGQEMGTFPWGDSPVAGDKANFCDVQCTMEWAEIGYDDNYPGTAPVGTYPKGSSIYGVMDMAGNVWEWVADYYDGRYYDDSPLDNPLGPTFGDLHVIRGGSWVSGSKYLKTSTRYWSGPDETSNDHGFRCVFDELPID